MKYWFTPDTFHLLASTLSGYKWKLLAWSTFTFILYALLQIQVSLSTPTFLIWLALGILFAGLQALVIASFIFFFQILPSNKASSKHWYLFYRLIEWCETLLFALLLPLPTLSFIYAIFIVN